MDSHDLKYLNFKFQIEEGERRDILNAYLLNLPFEGILDEDDQLLAFTQNTKWTRENQQLLIDISNELDIPFQLEEVPFENWNKIWESNYEPVYIDDLCVIKAPFHNIDVAEGVTEILITPQMAFGTGHHPTTKLMVRQMNQIKFKGKRVLDFGAGSGVLGILAKKWGAHKVVALEIDPYAVQNLIENIELNKVKKIKAIEGDLNKLNVKKYHIILANVNKNVLTEKAKDLRKKCKKNALLIISGILKKDEEDMIRIFSKAGFKFKNVDQEQDWICMAFKKN